jgi:phage repressor protein C with HTH and peptisase S24 domain
MDSLGWIRRGLTKPGKSQRGLAVALDIDPAGVNRLPKGDRQLKAAEIVRIAKYLGVEPPALLGGRGEEPSSLGGSRRQAYPVKTDAEPLDDSYAKVAVYDARAAAGAGGVGGDRVKHYLVFREQWLRAVTAAPVEQLAVIEIDGDSMEPTLRSGDHALVDRTEIRPRQKDGLYVIRVDGGLQVKRVSAHPVSGLLTISSDNPAYRSYADIKPTEVAVVGRVIWIGRRM